MRSGGAVRGQLQLHLRSPTDPWVLGMIEVRHGEGSFMALLFPLVVTQVKRGSYFLFEVLEIYTDA